MAFVNICGFETGDTSEVHTASGTLSVQGTTKRTGAYALQMNPSAAVSRAAIGGLGSNGAKATLGTPATCYFVFYVRWATLPSSQIRFFQIGNSATAQSGANECISGYIDSSGVFVISGNSTSSTIATLSTGTWYRIEVKAVRNGTCEAKVDGGTAQTATGVDNAIDYLLLGNSGVQTFDVYIDDVAISDSAYTGAGQVNILKPNAVGRLTGFAGGTGSSNWAEIDEVPNDSDTTYVKSTSDANFSTNMESAATGGVSGTIGVVKSVGIVRAETTGFKARIGLDDGANIDRLDTPASANVATTYATISKIHALTPAGGSWTSSDLDSIQGHLGGEDVAAHNARMTSLYVMVWCAGATASVPFRRSLLGVGF